jgi:PhnB protein
MTQIVPYLLYQDCEAALDWLTRAFAFEEVLRYTGEAGYVNHAEMRFDGVPVYMGNPGAQYRNPKELGQETVGIYVEMEADVDAHFVRAKAAGAEILEPPTDEAYGHRRYTARDPEGHHWFFAQIMKDVSAQDWGATTPSEAAPAA